MELDYQVSPGWRDKLPSFLKNWRLLLFVGVFVGIFGFVGYTFFSEVFTHGIHEHGNYAEVDLKSLGNFPFNDRTGLLTDVPKDFRELDGKRVELKGMMFDLRSAGPETNQFQLVYNIAKCCFNGPPQVQERVFVHMPSNRPVTMYGDLVDVLGKLHVRLKRNDDGTIVSVYDLDLESLKPV